MEIHYQIPAKSLAIVVPPLRPPLIHESQPRGSLSTHHHHEAVTCNFPSYVFPHCHFYQLYGEWLPMKECQWKRTLRLNSGFQFSSRTLKNQHQVACNMWFFGSWSSFHLIQPSHVRSHPVPTLSHEHASQECTFHFAKSQ